MNTPTPGAPNSGPRVGPIVISEIMYHPGGSGTGDAEYLELLNVSTDPVTLYDPLKSKAWRISNGIDFEFSAISPLTMAPGERVVLTKNLSLFNLVYAPSVPSGTKIFEFITGSLSNAGETLQLDRPGPVDALNVVQYIRQDRVIYDDAAPWPTTPDGSGPSLNKISEKDYGNDYINWMAAPASPGSAAPGSRFASWAAGYGVSGMQNDNDKDGSNNFLEYALGSNPLSPTQPDMPVLTRSGGRSFLSYKVPLQTTDVDYAIETSSNLQQWTRVDAAPIYSDASSQYRSYLIPVDRERLFFRLSVHPKP